MINDDVQISFLNKIHVIKHLCNLQFTVHCVAHHEPVKTVSTYSV